MDLVNTVKINKHIMALIRSKYDEWFPGAYSSPEIRYYNTLKRDTDKAMSALRAGGLAENLDKEE